MATIAISYRRDDVRRNDQGATLTQTLKVLLEKRFGAESVFVDEADLQPGVEWPDELQRQFGEARLVILLIGQHWNRPPGPAPDHLHVEVEIALQSKRRGRAEILGLLMGGIKMPAEADLPPAIRDVHRLHMLTTSLRADASPSHEDVERILDEAARLLRPAEPPVELPPRVHSVAAILVGVACLGCWAAISPHDLNEGHLPALLLGTALTIGGLVDYFRSRAAFGSTSGH